MDHTHTPPPSSNLELIYLDEWLLVVNKPAGLLAVPGRWSDKQDCLSARIQKNFPGSLIVHRLDMATSGVLMFARGVEAQRRLSQLFRERGVEKRYVAVVAGRVEPTTGEINLPLISDWPNRPRQKVDFSIGKPSLTRYRLLAYGKFTHFPISAQVACADEATGETTSHSALLPEDGNQEAGYQGERDFETSRVELEPVTGRTHQLRVHMAAVGHPIVGDALYGGYTTGRLLLHAYSLSFAHPFSAEPLTMVRDAPF